MKTLVGLSFSRCIGDMIKYPQLFPIDSVAFISAATCAKDEESWKYVIETYVQTESAWAANPIATTALAWTLVNEGLVLQPRLENLRPMIVWRSIYEENCGCFENEHYGPAWMSKENFRILNQYVHKTLTAQKAQNEKRN